MSFQSTIICRLEEDPIPEPEFMWNVTLNGTELPLDSVYYENGTLNLNGTTMLDNTSAVNVICNVSNIFGWDIANTIITPCGKFKQILVLYIVSATWMISSVSIVVAQMIK